MDYAETLRLVAGISGAVMMGGGWVLAALWVIAKSVKSKRGGA